jgi:hypothetical protein
LPAFAAFANLREISLIMSVPIEKEVSRYNKRLSSFNKFLLTCGVISSLWYVAINVIVPTHFDGYEISSQAVSELSAIGSPTRLLWVTLAAIYIVLLGLFALGILMSAGKNKRIYRLGAILGLYCVLNVYWPPMHLRGNETSLTDLLHIVWTVLSIGLMTAMMINGMKIDGKAFRFYTFSTLALFAVFGVLTGIEAPKVATDLSTPLLGIWERVLITLYLAWISVLAIILLTQRAKIETGYSSRKVSSNAAK